MNLPQNLDDQNAVQLLKEVLANQQDILAQNVLAPLSSGYVPWSPWAMRPSGLVHILNDLVINRRSQIVECGAGISTFYMARLLQQIDLAGHIYTLEHDQAWLNFVQERLNQEGLATFVTLIYAPLTDTTLGLENTPWYNLEAIAKALPKSQKIDLLLVDGPPAYDEDRRYSRYPALLYFLSQLSDNFMVVLDDADRVGETVIRQKWATILGTDFQLVEGNIAIARKHNP